MRAKTGRENGNEKEAKTFKEATSVTLSDVKKFGGSADS